MRQPARSREERHGDKSVVQRRTRLRPQGGASPRDPQRLHHASRLAYVPRAGRKVIRFQYRRGGSGRGGGGCDPNYTGACLRRDVSDYDCEGGSGDGPYYTGYVEVVGDDYYDLDRDGDGVACEW
jgi:hypothetical protein